MTCTLDYGRQRINMINIYAKRSICLPGTRLWCLLVGGTQAYVKVKHPSTAYVQLLSCVNLLPVVVHGWTEHRSNDSCASHALVIANLTNSGAARVLVDVWKVGLELGRSGGVVVASSIGGRCT